LRYTPNSDKVWLREEFFLNPAIPNATVVFGHTPTVIIGNEPGKIWHDPVHKDKIGIDCGVYMTGVMGCLRLDDLQEVYVCELSK